MVNTLLVLLVLILHILFGFNPRLWRIWIPYRMVVEMVVNWHYLIRSMNQMERPEMAGMGLKEEMIRVFLILIQVLEPELGIRM